MSNLALDSNSCLQEWFVGGKKTVAGVCHDRFDFFQSWECAAAAFIHQHLFLLLSTKMADAHQGRRQLW